MPLDWEEDRDDLNNTTYSAASPYHDEGVPFRFRIEPILADNVVVWMIDRSDEEVLPENDRETCFRSVRSAKATCQKWADEIVSEAASRPD